MGSTVYANGLAVATSTSGHWARSLPFDVRLVGPQKIPTPLPNNVPSTDIYTAYPSITRFADGFIWVEGTKAGPKSSPIDTWPGSAMPSAINSWATSKPGSGSNNVFAQAKRVYCFSHGTLQNEGNSMGILDDKPGVVAGQNQGDGQAAGTGLLDGDGNSGSDGDEDGEGGTADGSDTAQTTPQAGQVPEGECTLQSAKVSDGARAQSQEENQTCYLQMVAGTAKFEAVIDKPCTTQHPEWDVDGEKTMAALVEKRVRSNAGTVGAVLSGISSLIGILRIGTMAPRVVTGEIKSHHGTKRRVVHVFPADEATQEIDLVEGISPLAFAERLTFGGKIPSIGGELKITAMELKFDLSAQWTPEADWKCPLVAKIGFTRTIFGIEGRKYFNLEFLAAVPVVGWIISALYRINDAIRTVNSSRITQWLGFQIPVIPVPQGYVRVKLELKLSLFLKIKRYHALTPFITAAQKAAQIVWGENFSATIAIELGVGLSLGRAGEGLFACGGEIFVGTSFAGKHVEHRIDFVFGAVTLRGRLWMTYDLLTFIPERWRSSADRAMQALGVKLKDDDKKIDSDPFILNTAECVVWSLPLR